MFKVSSNHSGMKNHPTFNASILWGICCGGYLVVGAYWLTTAATIGTPLGFWGDLFASLGIVILEMALIAGIFSLLLRGLIWLFNLLARRFIWAMRVSDLLKSGLRTPWVLIWGLVGAGILLAIAPGNSVLWLFPLLSMVTSGGLIGLGFTNRSWMRLAAFVTAVLIITVSIYLFFFHGQDAYLATEPETDYNPAALQLEDPGLPGDFAFRYLTYGSGNDLRRAEYGQDVTIVTQPVDASLLWHGYDGFFETFYRQYWGFTTKELPLNARVWLPAGEGPFPLVLFVHGNHNWNQPT
ncbi:MAG: hypothetical protein AB1453_05185 [Chloroflexota bacterium]